MTHRARHCFEAVALAALVAAGGCTSVTEPASTGAAAAPLESALTTLGHGSRGELVVLAVEWTPPPGADGASHLAIGWRDADGRVTRLAPPRGAIGARVWRDDAVVLGEDGSLVRLGSGGARELASSVLGELATSDDGTLLAYTTADGELGALHVASEARDVIVARGLASAGRVRFTPDLSAVIFVGADSGGVAGVWVASVDGSFAAHALTNGALRAGTAWQASFVPVPGRAEDFVLVGSDVVRWTSEGRAVERTWRQP